MTYIQSSTILSVTFVVISLIAALAATVIDIPSDNVLAQTSNDTAEIQEYQFVTKWGSLGTEPRQFDGQNNVAGTVEFIYVPDYYNQRIQKFTNDGQFITMWGGSYGEADGEFANPHGVAIDSEGNVYVSERSGLRIHKFDPDGNFIAKWGSEGTGDGQFQHLHDIAIGPGGNGENASQSGINEFVYTTDTELFNVQKFTTEGEFIASWGNEGEGDGQFNQPEGIDVDSLGRVIVADTGNNRIQIFN